MTFEATHVVPQGGAPAWPSPDGSGPPSATLHAGTEVQLGERRGAWGHVTASNGWTGWVDGDRLVGRAPTSVPAAAPPPTPTASVPAAPPAAPPPPAPGALPPPPPGAVVPTATNGLAVTSLVLSILWLWWIGSILAVVFGHVALSQIKASGGTQPGRGLALAGVIMGWLGVGLLALGVLALAVDGTS